MNINYSWQESTHLTDDQQTDTANGQMTVIISLDLFFYHKVSFLFFSSRAAYVIDKSPISVSSGPSLPNRI
jgi:hypothetical protein